MAVVIAMPAMPIVGLVIIAVIWPIIRIAVRIVVTIRVISIVPRSEPNAEVDLSVGTWDRSKAQAPRHQCN